MADDPLGALEGFLLSRGFSVERRPKVVGLSGLPHTFALKVNKGQQEFLLDVVEKPEDLVKLYGKAYDLRGRSLLAIMRIKEAAPEIL